MRGGYASASRLGTDSASVPGQTQEPVPSQTSPRRAAQAGERRRRAVRADALSRRACFISRRACVIGVRKAERAWRRRARPHPTTLSNMPGYAWAQYMHGRNTRMGTIHAWVQYMHGHNTCMGTIHAWAQLSAAAIHARVRPPPYPPILAYCPTASTRLRPSAEAAPSDS